jgi:hypothetical protein
MGRDQRLEATAKAINNLEMKCITKRKHVRLGFTARLVLGSLSESEE